MLTHPPFTEDPLPLFPAIQMPPIEKSRMQKGLSIDMGPGAKHLHAALTRDNFIDWYAMDFEPNAPGAVANHNKDQIQLINRRYAIAVDVQCLPFQSNAFDIVICRGSLIFRADKTLGFREIARVLTPGGRAYVRYSMGMEDPTTPFSNFAQVLRADGALFDQPFHFDRPKTVQPFHTNSGRLRITTILNEISGVWVCLEKQIDPSEILFGRQTQPARTGGFGKIHHLHRLV